MSQHARISYLIVAVLMVLVAYLHLGTFLLTSLFGYLALQVFCIRRNKLLSVALYIITVAVIGAGLVYFSN
jgi:O-antigen ligase